MINNEEEKNVLYCVMFYIRPKSFLTKSYHPKSYHFLFTMSHFCYSCKIINNKDNYKKLLGGKGGRAELWLLSVCRCTCSHSVHVDFLQILKFPSTSQTHARRWICYAKIASRCEYVYVHGVPCGIWNIVLSLPNLPQA